MPDGVSISGKDQNSYFVQKMTDPEIAEAVKNMSSHSVNDRKEKVSGSLDHSHKDKYRDYRTGVEIGTKDSTYIRIEGAIDSKTFLGFQKSSNTGSISLKSATVNKITNDKYVLEHDKECKLAQYPPARERGDFDCEEKDTISKKSYVNHVATFEFDYQYIAQDGSDRTARYGLIVDPDHYQTDDGIELECLSECSDQPIKAADAVIGIRQYLGLETDSIKPNIFDQYGD